MAGKKGYLEYSQNIKNFLQILRGSSEFVSGESIAENLGVTRAQIFKIVRKLERLGYRFERKKGYKLLESPDLPFPWELGENVILFEETKSTQDDVRKLFDSSKIRDGFWVLALTQKKGKGRMGRVWESPKGNFYGSVLLETDIPMKDIVKISLLGGLVVFKTLKNFNVSEEIKIKWPNDVWVIFKDGRVRKISGCIAEAFGEPEKTKYVVLGIGVNVKSSPIKDVSASLSEIATQVSLVDFTRNLLSNFDNVWRSFVAGRWFELKTEIEDNMWKGRIRVKYDSKEFEGLSSGIAEDGSLIVQKDDANFENVYYGDVLIKTLL